MTVESLADCVMEMTRRSCAIMLKMPCASTTSPITIEEKRTSVW